MYTYFLILNDYGIRPRTLWDLSEKKSFLPKTTDVYNPSKTTYERCFAAPSSNTDMCILGNSNAGQDRNDEKLW
jgi:hypothetical protein